MVWISVVSLVVSIATMVVVWIRLGARGVVLLGNDGDGGAEAVPLPTQKPIGEEGGAEAVPLPTLSHGDGGEEAVPLPTLSPVEGGAEVGPLPTQQEGTEKGDGGTEGAGGWMAGLPIRMEGRNVVVDGDLVVRGNVSCYTRR